MKTPDAGNRTTRRQMLYSALGGGAALAAVLGWRGLATTPQAPQGAASTALPPPAAEPVAGAAPAATETAVLAGGCFWGVQAVFQHLRGVQRAVSGYAGGSAITARYEVVSSGLTSHAEAVQITYDPAQVSFGALLQVFFSVAHNPTELNRQGPDVGPQYRSAIFPENAGQKQAAQDYIAQLDASRIFPERIATRIEEGAKFYPAEAYHQDYLVENPRNPYIVAHDLPKLADLKRRFPMRYREEPVLVKRTAAS